MPSRPVSGRGQGRSRRRRWREAPALSTADHRATSTTQLLRYASLRSAPVGMTSKNRQDRGKSDMQSLAQRTQAGFVEGLAQGRMGVDRAGDVFQPRAHLKGEAEGGGKLRYAGAD